MSEQSAKAVIAKLVARFDTHRDAYLTGRYNETQLRREFVDPMWKALGWDVDNEQGYAEAYKDVIHEDAIKVSADTYTKAPDYCFRIGGVRKFFLEAKKPAVDIKSDPAPAFQLRRYAWSAKLPLSVLTDFEELAVYDTRIKPASTDRPAKARVLLLSYNQYVDKWDEIASVFSREAVLKGSFDKYAEGTKGKRGTTEVNEAFLEEIEGWRAELARNLALRNPSLSQRELNFAVQATIDRVVFLRISEDRGIEPYTQLLALTNGTRIYQRLLEVFQRADQRYNSGLFHFSSERGRSSDPDGLTPALEIDDKPLRDIIRSLYYPDSPYEFSVLRADILGHVYEQFLGKVIRLTNGHRAVVEEKPDVKKAGGVFYTPTFVVEYIVQETLGKLLAGKSPKEVAGGGGKGGSIRIVDPACGSGSFLLGAYQYLLDWHRDRYVEEGPLNHAKGRAPRLYQAAGGDWRLTTAERKRLLLGHIFGVDIDEQAVEVTKLSLLLKVLEGESDESLQAQLRLFQERALPDLDGNIKSGNSLIGPDFYEQEEMALDDDEDRRYRVNAFDWAAEFPDVFRGSAPGFDVVIGNPPYIRMELFKELKDYLRRNYRVHDERSDMYAYFIERAQKLLSRRGRFAMIVSNKFLRANYGRPLREFLREESTVLGVVDLAGLPVFRGATVRTIILATAPKQRTEPPVAYTPPLDIGAFRAVVAGTRSLQAASHGSQYQVSADSLDKAIWSFAEPSQARLLARLTASSIALSRYCDGQIFMGVKTGLTDAFVIRDETRVSILSRNGRAEEIIKPFVNGRDVRRYHIDWDDSFLLYTFHGVDIERYPAVKRHLEPYKSRLQQRATKQAWYELQQPQMNFAKYMDGAKIIFPDIATAPRFALDERGYYGSNTTYFIPRADLYLLGLLNSRVGHFYFALTCAGLEGKNETYLRFFGQYLEGFPVCGIDNADRAACGRRDRIIALVRRQIETTRKLGTARVTHDRELLERQVASTDKQIDRLVYGLYGLSEEEIRVIESSVEAEPPPGTAASAGN